MSRDRYTLLKDKLKKGQWIFTCSMQPLQFSHFEKPKNLDDYDPSWKDKSQEEQDDFRFDDFVTVEGSHHSIHDCSCKPVSEKYAKWFIKNKMWENFKDYREDDPNFNRWEDYDIAVRAAAERDGIEYEGY